MDDLMKTTHFDVNPLGKLLAPLLVILVIDQQLPTLDATSWPSGLFSARGQSGTQPERRIKAQARFCYLRTLPASQATPLPLLTCQADI